MAWIKVSVDYFSHRKMVRLVARLGERAESYPLRLWLWAAEHMPDGELRDIGAEELRVIVAHRGEEGELLDAMTACGYVEPFRGSLRIRNWDEHQSEYMRKRLAGGTKAKVEPEAVEKPRRLKRDAPSDKEIEAEFEQLWAVCSKKVSKGQALKTYRSMRKRKLLPDLPDLIRALERRQQAPDWSKSGDLGERRPYQPHLSTALNGRFWLDDLSGSAMLPNSEPVNTIPTDPILSNRWLTLADKLRDSIPHPAYQEWIEPLYAVEESEQTLTLLAPSARAVHSIEEQYRPLVDRVAGEISEGLQVIFLAKGEKAA